LYSTIEKNRIFGKLNRVDFSLKNIFETEVEKNENALPLYENKRENDSIIHIIL